MSEEETHLPEGWDVGRDYDGKVYYINHNEKKTTWRDPRTTRHRDRRKSVNLQLQQPRVPELHPHEGQWQHEPLYSSADTLSKGDDASNVVEDWRHLQEEMLCQYLVTAESDLRAKRELVDIKQQRLSLAKDEYHHLNGKLATLSTSTTSSMTTSPCLSSNRTSLNVDSALSSSCASSSSKTAPTSPMPPARSPYNGGRNPRPISSASAASSLQDLGISLVSGSDSQQSIRASQTSLNSTCSAGGTKYDPDLLKSDVQHARARVHRLQQELANIDTEVAYKQKGMETLAQVSAKYGEDKCCLSTDEAKAIRTELHNIQKSLSTGEQEKQELMKSLACLKDELTRLQHSESSLELSSVGHNPLDKSSTASQTDLATGEALPVGARLAELARLRLQYDESRRNVQDIQQSLAAMEERVTPGQLESDKDRLLLIQDKEQLLRELRSIKPRSRSRDEMREVETKISKLERDLDNAMEVSNRCIADRLRLHEEKQHLLQRLRDGMKTVSLLETQLKALSASTLSMSSSSSLGSLASSSHTSSKGSLSSLSFTDIYGLSATSSVDPSLLDLHRRVDKILGEHLPESGLASAEESLTTPDSDVLAPPQFPSPRHSLTDSELLVDGRQRKIQHSLVQAKLIGEQLSELGAVSKSGRHLPTTKLSTIAEASDKTLCGQELEQLLRQQSFDHPPLSPICEHIPTEAKVASIVSDESVTGDSGVYEAAAAVRPRGKAAAMMSLETAQVKMSLRYSVEERVLRVGVERARNLRALSLHERNLICIKTTLLPCLTSSSTTFTTRAVSLEQIDSEVQFAETFPLAIELSKLAPKTLQVTIWSVGGDDICLGSAQVSLADFRHDDEITSRWYNVLSFRFMQQPVENRKREGLVEESSSKQGTLTKELESSDESTVISSQTSTLTRNVNPDQFGQAMAMFADVAINEFDNEGSGEDEEEEEVVIPTLPEVLNTFELIQARANDVLDKQTNTECVFLQPSGKNKTSSPQKPKSSIQSAIIKRSQTFSPSAPINKADYVCKLNRSDSDSSMTRPSSELQRSMLERRSLRGARKRHGFSGKAGATIPGNAAKNKLDKAKIETSLDLELDLAAQKTKLKLLQDEINRLKVIKADLECAKADGAKEVPAWLQDHDHFQQILNKVHHDDLNGDEKVEKMLKKSGKNVYRLRKSKAAGKGDVMAFREKMAFFTSIKSEVPVVVKEEEEKPVDYESDPEIGVIV